MATITRCQEPGCIGIAWKGKKKRCPDCGSARVAYAAAQR